MRRVGRAFRQAGVAAIYLVHGTFAGTDALGILHALGRVSGRLAEGLRTFNKGLVDRLAGDVGNYTAEFAQRFEQAMHAPGEPRIPVRRFLWSGENHHVGRAHAAVCMLDELLSADVAPGKRVLLWGHSHAGNVFALLTNLLGSRHECTESFFYAARCYYRWPVWGRMDLPVWEEVRHRLSIAQELATLDMVTFGTPVRYGWETEGYGQLLHFVFHRLVDGLPDHQAAFPPHFEDVLRAPRGDYVQQVGIAGTDLEPTVWTWRAWSSNRQLRKLVAAGLRKRDLLGRLAMGVRVPDEGTTLLVDYGPIEGTIAQHLAGHGVYTQGDRLLFHAEEVARRFYGLTAH